MRFGERTEKVENHDKAGYLKIGLTQELFH